MSGLWGPPEINFVPVTCLVHSGVCSSHVGPSQFESISQSAENSRIVPIFSSFRNYFDEGYFRAFGSTWKPRTNGFSPKFFDHSDVLGDLSATDTGQVVVRLVLHRNCTTVIGSHLFHFLAFSWSEEEDSNILFDLTQVRSKLPKEEFQEYLDDRHWSSVKFTLL